MSIESGPIVRMPEEITLRIFSNLDEHSLARCTEVGRDWRRLASDDGLWKRLFPGLLMPNTGVRSYICKCLSRAILSNDELLERVRAFANKIQLNQVGRFGCRFPYNPEYRIVVGYTNTSGLIPENVGPNIQRIIDGQADREEVWFFMRPLTSSGQAALEVVNTTVEKTFFVVVGDTFRGMENEILSVEIGRIVSHRLEYLQNKPERDRELVIAITVLALSAMLGIGVGIYFYKQS